MRVVKQPEVRRGEIIAAAEKLFETHGYTQTSVEAIIKAAGIAKGTFYYYFKTKQELLTALVEQIGNDLADHFAMIVAMEDINARQKLELMLTGPEKQQKIKPAVMELLHMPENRELQEKLNIYTIEVIAPFLAQVVEEGNREGIFNTPTPLESVQLFLAGSLFILDSGLFNWQPTKRSALLTALQIQAELILGVKANSLNFIARR